MTSRLDRLNALRRLLRQRPETARALPSQSHRIAGRSGAWPLSAGCGAGEVSEWIAAAEGGGATALALATLRRQVPAGGRWLLVDGTGEFSSAGLAQQGLDLARTVFVQPREPDDCLWAVEQGLRSGGVEVVVWRRPPRLPPLAFRRLKLAAEAGRSRGLLLRGREALRETSWADVRLLVTPLPSAVWNRRALQVEVLKLRNGLPGRVIHVELDDETGAVYVVSELADPADAGRAAPA